MLQIAAGQSTNSAHNTRGNVAAIASVCKPGTIQIACASSHSSERRELATSTVVINVARTYSLAPIKSLTRLRALSTLAESFSYGELNQLVLEPVGEHITKYAYTTAKRNSLSSGAGCVAEKEKIVRRRIKVEPAMEGSADAVNADVAYAIDFARAYLTPLAYGTKVVKIDGFEIPIAKHELTMSAPAVTYFYQQAVQSCPEFDVHPLADSHFALILEAISGGKSANLTALDAAHWKYCVENGRRMRTVITIVTQHDAPLRDHLMEMQQEVETFMSSQYPLHLFDISNTAAHSKANAFGYDDSDLSVADKEDYCRHCGQIELLIEELKSAIGKATLKVEEETAEELFAYVDDVIVEDVKRYLGHVVRKTHEVNMIAIIQNGLDRAHGCLVRQDFKMKMLSLVCRESMPMFFGKRGFSWCGVSITRFKTVAEIADECSSTRTSGSNSTPSVSNNSSAFTEYHSEVMTEFYDILSDDSKEDAYSAGG